MSKLLLVAAAGVALADLPAQCVRFQQPTDTIRLTHNTVLGSEGTIEAVVYLEGSSSTGSVFNEWTDNAEDKLLRIGPFVLEGYGLLAQGSVMSTNQVATDRWHHVAFVYDASGQRLYFDGQLVATHPGAGSFSNGPGLGHLGGSPHPGHSSFRGLLDSFRISSTARYTGTGFPLPPRNLTAGPGTLVLYNFDEPAGSPTVADSSGNGNQGTLAVGFLGATAPSLGIGVMTCERAPGGQLNQQPIDHQNATISVAPGAPIQGTVNLRAYNDMHPGAVAPLAGTANWGSRTSQYWSINPWIATGVNIYPAIVGVTAPTQPGSYYLIFGFSGMYGLDQVMSSTHPAIPAVWYDGNDVGFDWTAQQFAAALANGGAVMISLRLPNGNYASQLDAFTAVRVDVLTSASVSQLGPGCPGTNGTPLLQSSLPLVGTTVVLQCQNLVPGQLALISWGVSLTDWFGVPLPLDLSLIGMPGCTLRSRPDFLSGGLSLGFIVAGFQLPSSVAWVGTEIYSQAIGFDPGLNPFGASLSNALTLTVGM